MCSAATEADITYHQYHVANGAAIRKALAHWIHEMYRAAHSSRRHPEWERRCQRFVPCARLVDVTTSQMSSIGVYHSANKKLQTRMVISPCRRAAPALRQILVALLLILTLSRFGDSEKGRPAHTPAMRCVTRLDRIGLWVKPPAASRHIITRDHRGCPKENLTHAVQPARQGIHRIKERSRSDCNLC